MGFELGLVGTLDDGSVADHVAVPDDHEAGPREPRREDRRRLQEVLDALEPVEPRHHGHQRRIGGKAQLAVEAPVVPLPNIPRQGHAVADDGDAAGRVALGHQALLDRPRVDQDDVGHGAGQALHAPLPRGEVVARVADGGDDVMEGLLNGLSSTSSALGPRSSRPVPAGNGLAGLPV